MSSPLPEANGFRCGTVSTHTSRTMMFDELSAVLDRVSASEPAARYVDAIVTENALGKKTQTTRKRTAQRLSELYALDPQCPLFRHLRRFWAADPGSRPVLACLTAAARDPLLREATPFVLSIPHGEPVTPALIANHLAVQYPGRFGPKTLLATAQRLASSWGQAGYLRGKVKKTRSRLAATPAAAAYAVLLGYLSGTRGRALLDTQWIALLDRTPSEARELVAEAGRSGWVSYRAGGGVVEVSFPGVVTPQEERDSRDAT